MTVTPGYYPWSIGDVTTFGTASVSGISGTGVHSGGGVVIDPGGSPGNFIMYDMTAMAIPAGMMQNITIDAGNVSLLNNTIVLVRKIVSFHQPSP